MNNDPFKAYGIQHLSPSTCNLFIGSPAAFVLDKCLKRKGRVGAAAHRGTAVECGVVHGLETGASDEECIQVAKDEFWRLTVLSADPALDKEALAVPEMVKVGLAELRGYGKPTATQGKIEHRFESIAVPFIGYFDVEWSNHNILVDLKTTHALPSKISTNHARQVSLYAIARGCEASAKLAERSSNEIDPRVTYITPKKSATYRVENVSEHVKSLERIGLAIQRFLSLSEDPMELAKYVMPDVESFYFKDTMTRQAVFEIWGV
jgi:hypothetical protein